MVIAITLLVIVIQLSVIVFELSVIVIILLVVVSKLLVIAIDLLDIVIKLLAMVENQILINHIAKLTFRLEIISVPGNTLVIFTWFINSMGVKIIIALGFVKIKDYSVIFNSLAKIVVQ